MDGSLSTAISRLEDLERTLRNEKRSETDLLAAVKELAEMITQKVDQVIVMMQPEEEEVPQVAEVLSATRKKRKKTSKRGKRSDSTTPPPPPPRKERRQPVAAEAHVVPKVPLRLFTPAEASNGVVVLYDPSDAMPS